MSIAGNAAGLQARLEKILTYKKASHEHNDAGNY
jgi:hypothetical protein